MEKYNGIQLTIKLTCTIEKWRIIYPTPLYITKVLLCWYIYCCWCLPLPSQWWLCNSESHQLMSQHGWPPMQFNSAIIIVLVLFSKKEWDMRYKILISELCNRNFNNNYVPWLLPRPRRGSYDKFDNMHPLIN